ncbi:hypothetical protein DFH28DRAFT_830409, partial [Melampsora americana]
LVSGREDNCSLTVLLAKLVMAANNKIQLPAKGRLDKQVHINVKSCANLLGLVDAASDQRQFGSTKRNLFQRPVLSLKDSKRVVRPLMNLQQANPTPNFDKLDELSEQNSILTSQLSAIPQQKAPNTSDSGSYAAAAT